MARRFTGLAALSVLSAVMLLTVACSAGGGGTSASPSATSPSATPRQQLSRIQQIAPLFMQCLIDHHITIWDRAEGNMNLVHLATEAGWYKDGHVVANDDFYTQMENWEGTWPVSPDFKPNQMIADWIDGAARTGTWPKVCGPFPKLS